MCKWRNMQINRKQTDGGWAAKIDKKKKKNHIVSIKFKVLLLVAGRLVDGGQSIDDVAGVI